MICNFPQPRLHDRDHTTFPSVFSLVLDQVSPPRPRSVKFENPRQFQPVDQLLTVSSRVQHLQTRMGGSASKQQANNNQRKSASPLPTVASSPRDETEPRSVKLTRIWNSSTCGVLIKEQEPIFIDGDCTVLEASRLLDSRKILSVPVWDRQLKRVIGIFDLRDLTFLLLLSYRKSIGDLSVRFFSFEIVSSSHFFGCSLSTDRRG